MAENKALSPVKCCFSMKSDTEMLMERLHEEERIFTVTAKDSEKIDRKIADSVKKAMQVSSVQERNSRVDVEIFELRSYKM